MVVRVEPRPADFEITDALSELRRFVAERRQGTSSEPVLVEHNGRVLVGCDLPWVDDRVGTVLQAHLFAGLASGPVLHLVQVTGSVGGAQAEEQYPTVRAVMRSLTVEASNPKPAQSRAADLRVPTGRLDSPAVDKRVGVPLIRGSMPKWSMPG